MESPSLDYMWVAPSCNMAVLTSPVSAWQLVRQSRVSGVTPADYAEGVVREFLPWAPPIDVHLLVTVLNVSLFEVPTARWAGAVNSTGSAAAIWVRASDHPVRKRFTIAHELGHLLLHDPGVAFRDDTFTGNWKEVQANRFAAGLLMPLDLVRDHYSRGLYRPAARTVARAFMVSEAAMRYRLHDLTGIDPDLIP